MRFLLFIIFFIFSSNDASAQVLNNAFQKGANIESGRAITIDAFGNRIITAVFHGSACFDLTNSGNNPCLSNNTFPNHIPDIYVAKYNSNWDIIWARKLKAVGGSEIIYDIVTDEVGDIYIAGQFPLNDFILGNGLDNLSNCDTGLEGDGFLIKLNGDDGLVTWGYNLCGPDMERFSQIDVISEGLITTGLFSSSSVDFDFSDDNEYLVTSESGYPGFLARYDFEGQLAWAYNFLNGDVAIDTNEDIIMAGVFSGIERDFDLKEGESWMSSDTGNLYIAKYDKDANLLWADNHPGSTAKVATDLDDNIYVASLGLYIYKLNPDGSILWNFQIPISCSIQAIQVDRAGNSYITANVTPTFFGDIDFNPSSEEHILNFDGNFETFYCSYDTDGNFKWAFTLRNELAETHQAFSEDLALTDDGQLLTIGNFYGQADFDPDTSSFLLTGGGLNRDLYLASYQICQSDTIELNEQICEGEIYDFSGAPLSTSGNYSSTLIKSDGCDSTILLNLTVLEPSQSSYEDQFCQGMSYDFNGTQLDTPGSYIDTLTGVNGCDSIINLELVEISISTNISLIGDTLTAESSNVNYQWLDSQGNAIDSAINQVFIPIESGCYSVQVSTDECSFISECIEVVITNLNKALEGISISTSPNPVTEDVLLTIPETSLPFSVQLFDINGRQLQSSELIYSTNSKLGMSNYLPGVYILVVKKDDLMQSIRLIKE